MKHSFSIDRSFDDHMAALATLLNACVADGASVGFVLPHKLYDRLAYWLDKVRPAVMAGDRVSLVAKVDGCLAGSVQLDCDTPPNQPHRAEVAKLLVHPDGRGHCRIEGGGRLRYQCGRYKDHWERVWALGEGLPC